MDAGLSVSVVDDNAVSVGVESGFDVVLISSSVSPKVVGSKFRSSAVPVVAAEPYVFDDLGLTANSGVGRGEFGSLVSLDVVDSGHPVAAGLSGEVVVNSVASPYSYGRPGAGASVVARLPGGGDRAGVFVYEAGASMVGLSAPAARVGLFLSYATPQSLTATGELLVVSAVGWAIDGGGTSPPADTTPPRFPTPGTTVGPSSITLDVRADEPVTVEVTVRRPNGSLVAVVPSTGGFAARQAVVVDGLSPSTVYDFEVSATDASGNTASRTVRLTTAEPGSTNTVFDLWYGSNLRFGELGFPQRWVNVLGSVSDPDGVASLSYRLNGGPRIPMGIGPDDRRLANAGDFNVDLLTSDLSLGANQLLLKAVDRTGEVTTTTVTVNWRPAGAIRLPYPVDWSTVSEIQAVGQVVDGHWTIDPTRGVVGMAPADAAYDRIILLGDLSWEDYEIRTRVKVIDFSNSPSPLSFQPGFGFLVHWNGHNDTVAPGSQPFQGFRPDPTGQTPTPFGAITWWRDGRARVMNHRAEKVAQGPLFSVSEGSSYEIRTRVTTPGTKSRFQMKIWRTGTAEPSAWSVDWTSAGLADEPGRGSIGLLAHEVQVEFGLLVLTPA